MNLKIMRAMSSQDVSERYYGYATVLEALVVIPIATTIISQEEIKDRQYRNLEQAYKVCAGVAFSTDAHGGQNITMLAPNLVIH